MLDNHLWSGNKFERRTGEKVGVTRAVESKTSTTEPLKFRKKLVALITLNDGV